MENSNSSPTVLMYSSISRRFGALVLDAMILLIPSLIIGSFVPVIGGLVVWFFYAPIMESSEIRATLGKHLMGIQVCDEMGRRISFRAALIRNILKIVSSVILFLGFITALFTVKKQALHDMLADTFVVYGRSDREIPEAWMANVKEVFNSTGGSSKISELERLQVLREKGTLSEDEFQAAKRKILGDV